MAKFTIVGAGQAGLMVGIGLLDAGHAVRMVSNRTPEQLRDGKVMSSQCMFGAALAREAQLGLDFFFVDGWLTLPEAEMMGRSNTHSHIGGSLSLNWTPWEFLEIYASMASWYLWRAAELAPHQTTEGKGGPGRAKR